MKIAQSLLFGTVVTAFLTVYSGFSASLPNATGTPAQMIVTLQPARGSTAPDHLEADDLSVLVGKTPARVLASRRLAGDLAQMQLFILLDDSTRSSSLGIQLPELKTFVRSLPANTEVAVGYMRNGAAAVAQGFTADHDKAAASLRLPLAAIYLRDTGLYDRGARTTLFAQSRLLQVSEQTGGYAYFQDFTDPVSIPPFLNDFQNRLNHQYQVTIEAFNKGVQPVQVRSEVRGLKIEGPTRIYVP